MKLPVYAVRDVKQNSFLAPSVGSNDFVMARSFAESIASRRDPIMAFSPKDFDLYRIGEYDMDTGALTPIAPVILVVNAAEVLNQYDYKKE